MAKKAVKSLSGFARFCKNLLDKCVKFKNFKRFLGFWILSWNNLYCKIL
ncbi:hypothetical protein [Helicobacter sp. 16-1353]|nr:hypothetical protein [Helicobacter sp. 16-1353]